MKEYKCETIGTGFTIDKYSAEGWEIHSFQVYGFTASGCTIIFE